MTVPPGSSGSAEADTAAPSAVRLDVPADVAYVSIVRTLSASLAARCSLTIDEIEDLRIAVDEACALLVTLSVPGSVLRASFGLAATSLSVSVDVDSRDGAVLDRTGFGWTVLDALAHISEVRDDEGHFGITMTKQAEEAVSVESGESQARTTP